MPHLLFGAEEMAAILQMYQSHCHAPVCNKITAFHPVDQQQMQLHATYAVRHRGNGCYPTDAPVTQPCAGLTNNNSISSRGSAASTAAELHATPAVRHRGNSCYPADAQITHPCIGLYNNNSISWISSIHSCMPHLLFGAEEMVAILQMHQSH